MANLPESAVWEIGIYQIEVTDPVIGGVDGISNSQGKQLANRTAYLKDAVDTHETRIDNLQASTSYLDRLKGAGSLVKQGVVTSAINNNVFDFISVAKISTSPIQNRVTVTANATSPLVIGFSKGYDANGPIVYYGIVTSTQQVNSGSNTNGLLYAEYNESTGAVTFDLDITTTSLVVSYNTPSTTGYWYSLKDEKMYKWNGTSWDVVVRVIIASVIWNGSGSYTYSQPIGKGTKDVYGRGHVPAGAVNAFAGANAPDGYLICNGGAISRSIYSDLYEAIGTTYGTGDGSTTFNLPDLRGEFVRGLDGGRGIDTDTVVITGNTTNGSATISSMETTYGLTVGMSVSGTGIPAGATIASIVSRKSITISANATATGSTVSLTFSRSRTLGSSQAHMVHKHDHMINTVLVAAGSGTTAALGDTNATGNLTQMTGGSETRPRNIAMNYIIKF